MREVPTVSLVIETENLKGGGEARDELASLERLMGKLRKQSFGLSHLRELVITHHGIEADGRRRVEAAAGRPVRFVAVDFDAGYYGAKNAGFDASAGQVVVFGDSDCVPDERWLERLCAPFASGAQVVAGRTVYRDDVLGRALTSIDFLYFASPLAEGCTRNFYANNVAFRREVFAAHRFPEGRGFYRGECQLLGLELHRARIPVSFAEDAVTVHRLPDALKEELGLRLLRGADAVSLAPHLAREILPHGTRALTRLPGVLPAAVLGGRYLFSAKRLATRTGASKLTLLAELATMTAASSLDALGALGRDMGGLDAARRSQTVLSYHAPLAAGADA